MEDQKNRRSLFAKLTSWADMKLLSLRNKIKYRIVGKLSSIHIVIAIFIGLTVLIIVAKRSWFGNPQLPSDIAELYFGAGAVTGAMLAIVFAFSSQLVSRASEALPARYFNIFARDTRLDTFYIILGLITVLEFTLGVVSLNSSGQINTLLLRLGIWLVLVTVILLYFSYTRLITLLSHEHQVAWLAKYHMSQIKELTYLTKRMARASQRGFKNLTDNEKLIIEGNMYEPMQAQIKTINDNLDGVIELYFTYKNKGDDYAAHNYIHVAFGMVMSYTLSRQKNSLLKINPEAGLTPESSLSAFLQTSFEKLKIIWDKALAENDVYAIRKYLRDVQGLVRVSLMVEHPQSSHENPAYFTAYYNFSQLIKESTKAKNVDALFEIASVLEQVTEIAVTKKHRTDALEAVLKDIQSICIATAGGDDDMSSVTHNVIKNMLTICNRILTQNEIDDHRLRTMQQIVPMCLVLYILGTKNSLTDIAVTHFGDNIFAMATHNMDEPPTKKQIRKVIQTSKFVISILQKLASIANGNRYETQSMNRSIMIMAHTLTKILNDELATEQQAQDIRWILNDLAQLPGSFPAPDKTKSLNDIEDFIDQLIQAGVIAVQANQIDVATKIFDEIHDYLHKMLTDKNSNVEVHEILHAVNDTKLIGATARKLRKQKLQQHVANRIREFETAYHAKYYPGYPKGYDPKVGYTPLPQMLRQERDDYSFGYHGSGLPEYFHDAKGVFLQSYTQDDLDNFEDYIWQH
ncbi:MAG: hypothetical protein ACREGJ_02740 [Candidatus Saccharimonadales bacterium]